MKDVKMSAALTAEEKPSGSIKGDGKRKDFGASAARAFLLTSEPCFPKPRLDGSKR
jgi:hypothetical protein